METGNFGVAVVEKLCGVGDMIRQWRCSGVSKSPPGAPKGVSALAHVSGIFQRTKKGSLKLFLVVQKVFWSPHTQSFTAFYLGIPKDASSHSGES